MTQNGHGRLKAYRSENSLDMYPSYSIKNDQLGWLARGQEQPSFSIASWMVSIFFSGTPGDEHTAFPGL